MNAVSQPCERDRPDQLLCARPMQSRGVNESPGGDGQPAASPGRARFHAEAAAAARSGYHHPLCRGAARVRGVRPEVSDGCSADGAGVLGHSSFATGDGEDLHRRAFPRTSTSPTDVKWAIVSPHEPSHRRRVCARRDPSSSPAGETRRSQRLR